ncbi:MAG: LacI family transcriptional regulator [Gaiellaceae bacterium]|jgi:LacI family transcriptional regulator|nr:LacI family transcriptional regulator [Gaiellaceae bacterium]
MASETTPKALTAQEVCDGLDRQDASVASQGDRAGQCVAFLFNSPPVADPLHAFFGPLVSSARRRAELTGADIVLCAPASDVGIVGEDLVERAVARGAQGLVFFGGEDGNPDVLGRRWPDLPAVFVEFDAIGGRSAYIGVDNEGAFGEVVLHLAESGRSRIATITGFLHMRVAAERLVAYRDMLGRLGYPIRPEYIEAGDFLHPSAYESTQRLLALDTPPDAIAACCDVQAAGAIRAIEDAGLRCPEDVAVTGFDDASWAAAMSPSLTTVSQPVEEMGVRAVDMLFSMIDEPALAPPAVLLPARLVVRASSGAPG